jgi:hypothetical protein
LFCAIGLHDLARDFLLTTKNGGGRSVLPIDNGEVASFNPGRQMTGANFDQSKFSAIWLTFAAPRRPISR